MAVISGLSKKKVNCMLSLVPAMSRSEFFKDNVVNSLYGSNFVVINILCSGINIRSITRQRAINWTMIGNLNIKFACESVSFNPCLMTTTRRRMESCGWKKYFHSLVQLI